MSEAFMIQPERRTPGMLIGSREEKATGEVPVRICMVKNSRFGGGRVARATCLYRGKEIFVEVPTKGEPDYIAIRLAFDEVLKRAESVTEDLMSGGTAAIRAEGGAKIWVPATKGAF